MTGAPTLAATDPAETADHAVEARSFPFARVLAVVAIAGVALVSPLWLLLLSPLLLGTPHVAQDVRLSWLHLPGGLPKRVAILAGIPLAILVLHRAAWVAEFPLPSFSGARFEIAVGIGALLAAALATPARTGRRLAVLLALGVIATLALLHPYDAMLALGHLHNLVALLLVTALSSRFAWPRRLAFLAFCLVIAAALFTDSAVALARASWLDRLAPAAFDWSALERSLAPGLPSHLAARLVLVFAFMQALHYAAWLAWLPAATRPRSSLISDLGPTLATIFGVIALAVIACAWFDPIATRTGYLSLVLFHGWLELAAITVLVTRGGSSDRVLTPS